MNRREFLLSLAALGAAVAVPFGKLATASEALIDQTWEAAIQEPMTFYVKPAGTLSFGTDENWPQSRTELLGVSLVASRADLFELAGENGQFECFLENDYLEQSEDDESIGPDWQSWVAGADDDTLAELIDRANDWVYGQADGSDWEFADLNGYSDRGAALAFFRGNFEFNDTFNIEIVEGCHPGSTYYAAELRMDVDEANELARELDIPIRFAWQG